MTRPVQSRIVTLSTTPMDRADVRLYHKTTERAVYDEMRASSPDAFDVVLWNAAREITELTRGNIVVEIDGERVTPPVSCGLLPGVLRAELLERREIRERVVTVAELLDARRVWFINALRGWVPIELAQGQRRRREPESLKPIAGSASAAPQRNAALSVRRGLLVRVASTADPTFSIAERMSSES